MFERTANKAIKNRTTKSRCTGLASSPFIAALAGLFLFQVVNASWRAKSVAFL
jgi:hypothetical protein